MDLIERIAREMAMEDDAIPVFKDGVWYNEEVHKVWLKRARVAHRVMKEEMRDPAPRVLPFLMGSRK